MRAGSKNPIGTTQAPRPQGASPLSESLCRAGRAMAVAAGALTAVRAGCARLCAAKGRRGHGHSSGGFLSRTAIPSPVVALLHDAKFRDGDKFNWIAPRANSRVRRAERSAVQAGRGPRRGRAWPGGRRVALIHLARGPRHPSVPQCEPGRQRGRGRPGPSQAKTDGAVGGMTLAEGWGTD